MIFDNPAFRSLVERVETIQQTGFYPGAQFVNSVNSAMTGALDGTSFTIVDLDGNTIDDLMAGSLILVLRRGILREGFDYTHAAGVLTMTVAPFSAAEVADPAGSGASFDNFYLTFGIREAA